MFSQEEIASSVNASEVKTSTEQIPVVSGPVVANQAEMQLQFEQVASAPLLPPTCPQPYSSGSVGGQVPGQVPGQEPDKNMQLACKIMYDDADWKLAMAKQLKECAMKFKAGEVPNLVVPVTADMLAEQRRRREANWEGVMRMEQERNAAIMATLENEEVLGSSEDQVGGNVCTHACAHHCPSASNVNQGQGQGD